MTESCSSALCLVPLHRHPEHLRQCCQLLNAEWPRSETARMLHLQTSRDRPPTCLVLLLERRVIGHCKLTPIPAIADSCFVESVVIDKSLRGKGLGTFLMKECEEYCRIFLCLNTIHLSTKGQEKFYEKLGYTECEPISIYGSLPQSQSADVKEIKRGPANGSKGPTIRSPPPPPMPIKSEMSKMKPNKTYMVKSILL